VYKGETIKKHTATKSCYSVESEILPRRGQSACSK